MAYQSFSLNYFYTFYRIPCCNSEEQSINKKIANNKKMGPYVLSGGPLIFEDL